MLDLREPHDISTPTPGFYKMRQVKRGPWVPVKIEFRASRDPETGEELDRSPTYHATLGGTDVPIDKVWPWCAGEPILQAEYDWRLAVKRWAVEHAPEAPEANPRKAIDLRHMPPIFGGSRK